MSMSVAAVEVAFVRPRAECVVQLAQLADVGLWLGDLGFDRGGERAQFGPVVFGNAVEHGEHLRHRPGEL
ncbi:MAG: hypothetical protein ACRDTH_02995 [Pseudonocardiaceae bacterium]